MIARPRSRPPPRRAPRSSRTARSRLCRVGPDASAVTIREGGSTTGTAALRIGTLLCVRGSPVTDVVVVGAGIVGASVAYHAARAGAAVLLIDRSLQRPALRATPLLGSEDRAPRMQETAARRYGGRRSKTGPGSSAKCPVSLCVGADRWPGARRRCLKPTSSEPTSASPAPMRSDAWSRTFGWPCAKRSGGHAMGRSTRWRSPTRSSTLLDAMAPRYDSASRCVGCARRTLLSSGSTHPRGLSDLAQSCWPLVLKCRHCALRSASISPSPPLLRS